MLTSDFILSKCPKYSDISDIKKLNIWGEDIEDISIISQMTKLTVLSLSANKISDLSPLAHCLNLRELYLRNNYINSFDEISHLKNLPKLKILWLEGNPISDDPNYTQKVLKILPQISIFDNQSRLSIFGKVKISKKNQSENKIYNANISEIKNKHDKNQHKKIILKRVLSFMELSKEGRFETSNECSSILNNEKNNNPSNKKGDVSEFKIIFNTKRNQNKKNKIFKKLKLKIKKEEENSKNNNSNNLNNNIFHFMNLHSKRKMSDEASQGPIPLKLGKLDNNSIPSITSSTIKGKSNSPKEVILTSIFNENKNKIGKNFINNKEFIHEEKCEPKINNFTNNNNSHVMQAIFLLVDKMNLHDLLCLKDAINKKISILTK